MNEKQSIHKVKFAFSCLSEIPFDDLVMSDQLWMTEAVSELCDCECVSDCCANIRV